MLRKVLETNRRPSGYTGPAFAVRSLRLLLAPKMWSGLSVYHGLTFAVVCICFRSPTRGAVGGYVGEVPRVTVVGGPKEYACLNKTMVRAGASMTSERVGFLEVGQTIVVLSEQNDDAGLLRVQYSEGWVSMVSSAGKQILGSLEEGAAIRKANLAAAAAALSQSDTTSAADAAAAQAARQAKLAASAASASTAAAAQVAAEKAAAEEEAAAASAVEAARLQKEQDEAEAEAQAQREEEAAAASTVEAARLQKERDEQAEAEADAQAQRELESTAKPAVDEDDAFLANMLGGGGGGSDSGFGMNGFGMGGDESASAVRTMHYLPVV